MSQQKNTLPQDHDVQELSKLFKKIDHYIASQEKQGEDFNAYRMRDIKTALLNHDPAILIQFFNDKDVLEKMSSKFKEIAIEVLKKVRPSQDMSANLYHLTAVQASNAPCYTSFQSVLNVLGFKGNHSLAV